MTRKQLEKFIKLRNTSDFQTNLQFQIDADASGFKVSDLGDPKVIVGEYGIKSYEWATPYGTLREHLGVVTLTKGK